MGRVVVSEKGRICICRHRVNGTKSVSQGSIVHRLFPRVSGSDGPGPTNPLSERGSRDTINQISHENLPRKICKH